MQIEKQLQKTEDRQFVESAHQVVKRVKSLLACGDVAFARIEIEASHDWKTLCSQGDNEAWGETLLWLEELLGKL